MNELNLISQLCHQMPWYWVNQNIHISLKHKYVYFETPKVGCSSIKKTLIKFETGELYEKYDLPIHPVPFSSVFVKPFQLSEKQLSDILKDKTFFKFTFVRDPYSRALSGYLDKMVGQLSGYTQMIALMADKEVGDSVEFLEFLQTLQQMQPHAMNSHFRPLSNQLFSGLVDFDFIGKFESYSDDFGFVMSKLGVPEELHETVVFHQTSATEKLQRYYSSAEVELVKNIYAEDFRWFGYSTGFSHNET